MSNIPTGQWLKQAWFFQPELTAVYARALQLDFWKTLQSRCCKSFSTPILGILYKFVWKGVLESFDNAHNGTLMLEDGFDIWWRHLLFDI